MEKDRAKKDLVEHKENRDLEQDRAKRDLVEHNLDRLKVYKQNLGQYLGGTL